MAAAAAANVCEAAKAVVEVEVADENVSEDESEGENWAEAGENDD